jgi:hypothetical protein
MFVLGNQIQMKVYRQFPKTQNHLIEHIVTVTSKKKTQPNFL